MILKVIDLEHDLIIPFKNIIQNRIQGQDKYQHL
jgi:hypothetical protein